MSMKPKRRDRLLLNKMTDLFSYAEELVLALPSIVSNINVGKYCVFLVLGIISNLTRRGRAKKGKTKCLCVILMHYLVLKLLSRELNTDSWGCACICRLHL